MITRQNYLHKKQRESDEKSYHPTYLNFESKNRQQKWNQDAKISQNVPGQIFGQWSVEQLTKLGFSLTFSFIGVVV